MRFIYTKTFIRIFTIFLFLSLLVILDARGYLGLVKDGFFRVYGYGQTKLADATGSLKVGFSTLFTIKNLVNENAKLNQQVDDLTFQNARLISAQDENAALRAALKFTAQSTLKLVPVEVLSLDITGFNQTIVINKGSDFGFTNGQPVVVQPGLLVGKITKVYPNSSEVTLITDPSIVVNGEVVDSGAKGLVKGEHGLGLSFDLVTQNELIKTGDNVITSGLSQDFPRGILIGTVNSIRSSSTDLFQKAFIAPAADLRSLKFLFVVSS